MVARHFLEQDEVLRYLILDKDFSEEQAVLILHQVEGRDYNPPRRERILEWRSQQDFPDEKTLLRVCCGSESALAIWREARITSGYMCVCRDPSVKAFAMLRPARTLRRPECQLR
jgi:hypothetical protein